MDYAERRLQGHPKLEFVALPVIGMARDWLGEPSAEERRQRPFVVPAPPPVRIRSGVEPPILAATGAADRRVLRVGPFEEIRRVADAARIARDGDIVEIMAGEYHGDVAVWLQKRLTIRGVGGQARLHAGGQSAEGKAIWVIRNGEFKVSNIDFVGARAEDRNGAGIRFENGYLVVRHCLFWGGDSGILTSSGANHRTARLEVHDSEFGYNGHGDGQSHQIYVGAIDFFRVTGSYFHHANVGHLVKSRAERSEILYNRLTDESGGRASYEIDLPNGGVAVVLGNIVQQGRETENSALVSYGREGFTWPVNRLFLASNTLVNDHPYGGAFLRAASGADSVVSVNNLLVGKGRYHVPEGLVSDNDVHADWSFFRQASRQDYRLADKGRALAYRSPAPRPDAGVELVPRSEYLHPRLVKGLVQPPRYPGAVQTGDP